MFEAFSLQLSDQEQFSINVINTALSLVLLWSPKWSLPPQRLATIESTPTMPPQWCTVFWMSFWALFPKVHRNLLGTCPGCCWPYLHCTMHSINCWADLTGPDPHLFEICSPWNLYWEHEFTPSRICITEAVSLSLSTAHTSNEDKLLTGQGLWTFE